MPRKPPVKPPPTSCASKKAIEEELSKLDITPTEVAAEPVAGTRLYRFRVVASKFSKLRHIERQDLVWRLVRRELGDDEQLHTARSPH